ncbi:DUF4352 domain-containing protein [Terrabacter aerolatus]|uniref:Mpr protein n=1 Tax=Terrabacter aerolatus TaxID=422442 RepID=A0A512D5H5_9MICO|nr:DUF4352 domain-containing protein [Terrabacter aerolatus]GEO31687.1 Mpr protein [Terrabacter aerolatus]
MSTNQPHDPTQQTTWQTPVVPAPPVPAPPRKSWFARHKIITGLLALVLIGVVASAVNGGGSSLPTTTSPGAAGGRGGDAPAEGAPASAKVGQKVRDGQFEFTVTKVQKGVKSVGDQYLNEKAQGQFVLVNVTVSNIGDSAQTLSDSSQKVRDAKGREFSSDTAAAIYVKDNKVFLEEINPGNTVKGTLVFDMPKGTEPASIELHDSPFSDGITVQLR